MAKIPYLIRRNNIFYFRLVVPVELRESVKVREFIQSLHTENREEATHKALKLAAHFKAALNDLKKGVGQDHAASHVVLTQPSSNVQFIPAIQFKSTAPLLSVVIDDFLKRYDRNNRATFTKLNATLPVFLELTGDKPINQILQADLNAYFDDVQKLPVRRDAKIFKGMSLREIIESNTGKCISEGTFGSTYRACASIFLNWAKQHYHDQGFPDLTVQGAVYRGSRSDGINKQRAMKHAELQILFGHDKMMKFAASSETAHYCWLPLIGLHTGARINEIAQLNPADDILQDDATGVWYFQFTDQSEAADGVIKSIKTSSSRRVVPIHSQLLNLGFLGYVQRVERDGHKILFPAWQPRKGKASANASKWFNRYLKSINLRDERQGARLSGFHSFRHTFITHGLTQKIQGIFEITGHEVDVVDGYGKISPVAKGYWTRAATDNILEKQATIEKFDFKIKFYKPV